jgi:predicted Zn-dependent peptidase
MAEDTGFGRLPRGAKILWERVGHSRTFSLGFFFATGSRFDPPGKAGTAHLVEHLVFKGTQNHTAASLARLVDRVGGDLNAWTDREEMAFTCTVPAEAWPVALEALSELCLHPRFPAEEFEREKEVIRNEILTSLEDPEELSYDSFLQTVSPGDWSRPVAGTEESLAGITLADAQSWWAEFGDPAGLTVAFSGGVDPAQIERAVSETLGEDPESASVKRPVGPRFSPVARRWLEKADFQMVQLLGGFTFPAPKTSREAAVWQVFSMLWGETMSSRLFQSIREQRGLCYSVNSQIFDAEGTWGLQFFSTCAPENVRPLLDALAEQIERLKSEPPTEDEWDDARAALRGGVVLGSEKTENRVGRLWRQFESFGEPWGADAALDLLSARVTPVESRALLDTLAHQKPSLLVWGKLPRRFTLPAPWDA